MCKPSSKVGYYKEVLNVEEIVHEAQLEQQDEAMHIVDLSAIVSKYKLWQKHMPRVEPHYAVKCNDDAIVLETLSKMGACFDCASKTEIKQIIDLGIKPERIIFAHPCKPISHLEYAREHHINMATVDNEFEIYKIYKTFPQMNLVMRFRCEAKEAQCPLGDKFGCDADSDVLALIMLAKSLKMNVVGTSFHVGSGCRDLDAYERAIKCSRNIFNAAKMLGYNMKLMDIGGGFPGSDDDEFIKITESINKSLEKYFPNDDVRIIAEPGRFFVAAAYTLICKIHGRREVRSANGKLDTIMYHVNDGVYGSFNCILYDHQHVTGFACKAKSFDKTYKSLVWGPTCDALDKIIEDIQLPNLAVGDFIIFPNMGAYSVPIASAFNGFLQPTIKYFINRIDGDALMI